MSKNAKNRKIVIILIAMFASICLFIIHFNIVAGKNIKIGWKNHSINNEISASYAFYTGKEYRTLRFEEGDTITFEFCSKAEVGKISLCLLDSRGKIVKVFPDCSKGRELVVINNTDYYTILVEGLTTKGYYKISWERFGEKLTSY
ncbi:hypothetical protein [Clostridium polynesiense]|uniref:hypothetical protein n=1 Tax=Clostridium polynesiense TaxID=1325933 RepID=UPI00058EBAD6|nr:hypothetical protein [Clostridium polynesiense]